MILHLSINIDFQIRNLGTVNLFKLAPHTSEQKKKVRPNRRSEKKKVNEHLARYTQNRVGEVISLCFKHLKLAKLLSNKTFDFSSKFPPPLYLPRGFMIS